MKKTFVLLIAAFCFIAPGAVAGNPLDALKGIVSNVTASSKFEIADITGTWKYSSPAVAFKGDNALSNVGGAAASATIENKLATYYKTLGLTGTTFTIDKDGNFAIKVKGHDITGTVTKDDDAGALTFHFNALKSANISAKATKSALGELSLTFDATKLMSVVKTLAQYSNNSTISQLSALLSNYDGLYAGAKFKKQ